MQAKNDGNQFVTYLASILYSNRNDSKIWELYKKYQDAFEMK